MSLCSPFHDNWLQVITYIWGTQGWSAWSDFRTRCCKLSGTTTQIPHSRYPFSLHCSACLSLWHSQFFRHLLWSSLVHTVVALAQVCISSWCLQNILDSGSHQSSSLQNVLDYHRESLSLSNILNIVIASVSDAVCWWQRHLWQSICVALVASSLEASVVPVCWE